MAVERVLDITERGLTAQEVKERMEDGRVNILSTSATKSIGKIVLENVFTFFNMIFVFIAAILIAVGAFKELTFIVIIVLNTGIGIVQELISKKKLDDLSLLAKTKAKVVRDGQIYEVDTEDLVEDDIVYFGAGSQIHADGKVIAGEIQVNEGLLTGESDEITKNPGKELFSGSYVISGECYARLTRVGEESYGAKLTAEAQKSTRQKKPGMMKSLTYLLYIIGMFIVPIGILLFLRQYDVLGLDVKESVENTAAAIIGMIPEGLYLLVSVALAVSVGRLAQKKILVQDLKSTETLARVDMLCVDKTGTITESKMEVSEIIKLKEDLSEEEVKKQLGEFVDNMADDNETMKAIKEYFKEKTSGARKAEKIEAFSSKNKYSSVTYGEGEVYYLGAPDILWKQPESEVIKKAETYAVTGARVLLFLKNETPLALVALKNPIRPSAKETFRYFKENQVTIKVISGDSPKTVSAVALEAGIEGAEAFVDMTTIKNKKDLEEAAEKYTVFGRVKPEQKRQLVQALQKQGHTVAMTGDGVNDVLALKSADCGVAMAGGSEAAAGVAEVVLLNSDFSDMPQVVAEGRRVINNIERTASLYLVKNIFSVFLAIISIIAVFEYPLVPSQLTLMSFLTIGMPSFVLALEPNESKVSGKFLRKVIYRAMPAALADLCIIIIIVMFQYAFQIESKQTSTITALLVTAVGFYMVYKACVPFRKWHYALFGVMIVLLIGIIAYIPDVFSITKLNLGSMLILGCMLLLIPTFIMFFNRSREIVTKFYIKIKAIHNAQRKL
ncbi:HAD-IC family P-type ATPase [Roseburia sp. MSJ-14]|nr:HAD-IC family P-type ATPase [Roseburia sp. MSJ-14]MBU5474057.1 HAD-IC family P-type ATPase [Roseburia sp. MSJ-14]